MNTLGAPPPAAVSSVSISVSISVSVSGSQSPSSKFHSLQYQSSSVVVPSSHTPSPMWARLEQLPAQSSPSNTARHSIDQSLSGIQVSMGTSVSHTKVSPHGLVSPQPPVWQAGSIGGHQPVSTGAVSTKQSPSSSLNSGQSKSAGLWMPSSHTPSPPQKYG